MIGDGDQASIISSIVNGTVHGTSQVGGLAGSGTATEITNSSMMGDVIATGDHVGGLLGDGMEAVITSSSARGSVMGQDEVGGLIGNGNNASITSSEVDITVRGASKVGGVAGSGVATELTESAMLGDVIATGNMVGGLLGDGLQAQITSSYVIGDVSGGDKTGGLLGNGMEAVVMSSYALGIIMGQDEIGGLIGDGENAQIRYSYVVAAVRGEDLVGNLVGTATGIDLISSYWNKDQTVIENATGDVTAAGGMPLSTEELLEPTATSGVYADWTQVCMGGEAAWDFGNSIQYPALRCLPETVEEQRAAVPERYIDADGNGLIEIRTADELHNMRYVLDGSGYRTREAGFLYTNGCPVPGCHGYELVDDINLTGYGDGVGGWDPIGDRDNPFTARFEGNGYTISALFIDRSGEDDIGLFGKANGVIGNLSLMGADITGGARTGALIGDGDQASIISSMVDGTVRGSSQVGGLAGSGSTTEIINSSMMGDVIATGDQVGGLVGDGPQAQITSSYVIGDVTGGDKTGGLLGNGMGAAVLSSYAIGNVVGQNQVGGLIGDGLDVQIRYSYVVAAVSGQDLVGNLVGAASGVDITSSYWNSDRTEIEDATGNGLDAGGMPLATEELLEPTEATGIYADWGSQTCNGGEAAWDFGNSTQYPALRCLLETVEEQRAMVPEHFINADFIDADGNGLIEISTADELHNMRYVLDGSGYRTRDAGFLYTNGCPLTGCIGYELVEDIDLSGYGDETEGWDPIGDRDNPFTARFDGNGYTISALFIDRPGEDDIGLFGRASGTIRSLSLMAADITGGARTGGLIGDGEDASIMSSMVEGTVRGTSQVGGLIGFGRGDRAKRVFYDGGCDSDRGSGWWSCR